MTQYGFYISVDTYLYMSNETHVANSALIFSLMFYFSKLRYKAYFDDYYLEFSIYLLVIMSALFTFSYVNHLKLFYSTLVGGMAFACINVGIVLGGTRGLGNTDPLVIDGLSRIVIATFTVWKLSADMRHLTLQIDPYTIKRSRISQLLYGVIFPPKEFFRLLKFVVLIVISFYFVMSGLNILEQQDVNLYFLEETEKISVNLLFLGIQTPMMMASRASVSRTFSDYIKNLDWLQNSMYASAGSEISSTFRNLSTSKEISFSSINSNGKHLWFSVLLIVVLQAFENQFLAQDKLLESVKDIINLIWVSVANML